MAGGSGKRPDGSDLIFGGSGIDEASDADRLSAASLTNAGGDQTSQGHANDSDAIVADNGDIYRIVGVGGHPYAPGAYASFYYDNYSGTKIVVRGERLIDYTPGGRIVQPGARSTTSAPPTRSTATTATTSSTARSATTSSSATARTTRSSAATDPTGSPAATATTASSATTDGCSPAGSRPPTVSRCTGSRPSTRRRSRLFITTPGDHQEAVINPDGALKYTADLTPDSLDPAGLTGGFQDPYYRPPLGVANDIIYGGLGDDSIHGGAGDDAISGAEAPIQSYTNNYDQNAVLLQADLRSDYLHPFNPGNVLGYDPSVAKRSGTTFAQYDANDPLREILLVPGSGALYKGPINPSLQNNGSTYHDWLLNFDYTEGPLDQRWYVGSAYPAVQTDGNDMIFGDLQNDWVVGGTGRDIAFLGWGDDQANMDDRLNTDNGLNDVATDTNPSYEDFVYGGAGRDVLIANTGGDRLVDWTGEFNTYLVPFAPFGEPTVSRTMQPQLDVFMLLLSQSAGADLTLAAQHGGDTLRNGEPFGELGEVRQHDKPYWNDQHGGPRDPQAGNVPGGSRDVGVTSGTQAIQSPGTQGLGTPTSAAIKLPAHVGAGNPVLVPVQVIGPPTSTALVSITDGIHVVSGTGTIGAGGVLQLNFDLSSLNDGPITITLILIDAQGHQSAPIVTTSIKDSVPPAVPTITAPATVGLADLTTFTITISGESLSYANWSVTDGLILLGESVQLDATGHATIVVDVSQLVDGVLTTSVSLTDLAGNTSTAATATTTKSTGTAGTAGFTVGTSNPSGAEQGQVPITFVISRSGNTSGVVTVNLGWGGTAMLTSDYTLTVSTGGTLSGGGSVLTVADGITSVTITAKPVDDTLIEPDESVILTLTAGTGSSVGTPSSASGTIADNDTPVINVAATDASGAEQSQNTITFTVTRTVNTTVTTVVNLGWGGTATLTGDYTLSASGGTLAANFLTLTFAPGQSTATITVKPVDDTIIEPTETVILSLAGGTNYTIGASTFATGTIADNDTPVITVAATDASGAEQAQDPIVFKVTRTGNTTVTSVINLDWSGGTASLPADYTLSAVGGALALDGSTLTFAPGASSATITVKPVDDTISEGPETVVLAIAAGTNYTAGSPASATGTIADNDALVTVAATDASGAEQGQDPIVFTFTRSNSLSGNIVINLGWSGSATLTSDYTLSSSGGTLSANGSTLTMYNGDTSVTVTAKPVDDAIIEPAETVVLTLGTGTGYSVASPGTANGTIADNDTGTVNVVATDANGAEQAQDVIVFTITRTVSTSTAITIGLAWTGTATLPADYILTAVGGMLAGDGSSVTMAAGVSTVTVTAKPVDDTLIEPAETVMVTLNAGSGYTVGASTAASGTIADNDTPVVTVAATDPNGAEQGQDPIVFTVTRTVNTTVTSIVNLTWSGTATLTTDYTLTVSAGATLASNGSTLTLNPGTSSVTITAKPIDDALIEGTETVTLTLASGTNYAVGATPTATGSIVDNEFSVSVGSVSTTEGDKKNTSVTVPVTLSGPSTGTITVTATTVAGSALAGSDFVATTQVLTFSPGTTTVNFTVTIIGDTVAEPTETFTVVLSAPVGATIATGTGTVTIFDNDGAQMATAAPAPSAPAVDRPLTQAALDHAVAQAKADWSAALPGVDLSGITVTIADLPNLYLGFTMTKTITIDATAAGWGWSVMDPAGTGPRMDLLTVVRHELGRAIGLTEADADRFGVMALTLGPGVRRSLVPAGEARAVALSPARASMPGATSRSGVRWLGDPSLVLPPMLVGSGAGHGEPRPYAGDLVPSQHTVAPAPAQALPARVASTSTPTATVVRSPAGPDSTGWLPAWSILLILVVGLCWVATRPTSSRATSTDVSRVMA